MSCLRGGILGEKGIRCIKNCNSSSSARLLRPQRQQLRFLDHNNRAVGMAEKEREREMSSSKAERENDKGKNEGEEKKEKEEEKEEEEEEESPPEKPEPGDCCGSGCVRCVWDVYYDELEDYNKRQKQKQEQKKKGG